jgi:decaprenylphospho-beta-D-ribofuranose 2-oxidase
MTDHGDSSIVLDHMTGLVTADARVSLERLMTELVPQGWFVPVTPGTRQVTVGGAIASDIHGKNHHVDGSFGDHVVKITLLTSEGDVRVLTPNESSSEFWATVGGMGLTGVILNATFKMIPITTSRMRVETSRAENLSALMAAMQDDRNYRYSVAWIDLVAKGTRMGRGVLTRGDHASLSDLKSVDESSALEFNPKTLLSAPPIFPTGMLNKWTVSAFNELWFRKAPARVHESIETIGAFFHPLDGVRQWNRLYGRSGFVQYQFVIPFGAEDTLEAIVQKLSAENCASFLAVLKYFGKANPGPLSFPMEGWTLALDVPAHGGRMAAVFAEVDELVLRAGGRHYLAKDAHIRPDAVVRGYPRLQEWCEVQQRMDPRRMWQSDLARRLRLTTG